MDRFYRADEDGEGGIPHRCACGETWNASMFFEGGGYRYFNDDDCLCPECGQEGTPNI